MIFKSNSYGGIDLLSKNVYSPRNSIVNAAGNILPPSATQPLAQMRDIVNQGAVGTQEWTDAVANFLATAGPGFEEIVDQVQLMPEAFGEVGGAVSTLGSRIGAAFLSAGVTFAITAIIGLLREWSTEAEISTHTPREGRDFLGTLTTSCCPNFNSHAP